MASRCTSAATLHLRPRQTTFHFNRCTLALTRLRCPRRDDGCLQAGGSFDFELVSDVVVRGYKEKEQKQKKSDYNGARRLKAIGNYIHATRQESRLRPHI